MPLPPEDAAMPAPWYIRKGKPHDTPFLLAGTKLIAAKTESRMVPADLEDWVSFVLEGRFPNVDYLVAAEQEADRPLGFCLLSVQPSDFSASCYLWMETLYVADDHRMHGIGIALVERIEEIAAELGAIEIRLHILPENGETLEWVRRRGFTESKYLMMTKPVPADRNSPAIIFPLNHRHGADVCRTCLFFGGRSMTQPIKQLHFAHGRPRVSLFKNTTTQDGETNVFHTLSLSCHEGEGNWRSVSFTAREIPLVMQLLQAGYEELLALDADPSEDLLGHYGKKAAHVTKRDGPTADHGKATPNANGVTEPTVSASPAMSQSN